MADTTTVFILYAHAAFLSDGDENFLSDIYPYLTKAAMWQMNRTRHGINHSFPSYLQSTYDYLGLDEYPAQAYTGFLHLAAMRSMRSIALILGDQAMVNETTASEQLVSDSMQGELLWTGSFFRAFQNENYTAPDVAMAGSLHGQSWAHANGLGYLVPESMLRSHLEAELQQNCYDAYDPTGACVFGLLPLAQLPQQSSWAQDGTPSVNMDHTANVVWLELDNASFLLSAHAQPSSGPRSLHPALAVIDLYRDTLHDFWNWHDLHVGPFGLTCEHEAQLNGTELAGTPFVNSHYARQLQGWAIVRALAGQQWNAHDRSLVLKPKSVASYFASSGESVLTLPFFAGKASGKLVLLLVDGVAPLRLDESDEERPTWLTASITVLAGSLQATMVHVEVRHNSRAWLLQLKDVKLAIGEKVSGALLRDE